MGIEHKFLNKLEADALFHRRAVAFGTRDVLPVGSAAELFGPAAVKNIIDRMQLVTQHNAAIAKRIGMDAIKMPDLTRCAR